MATYRSRTYDRDGAGSRILRGLAAIAVGALAALLVFVAAVWFWVGTAP